MISYIFITCTILLLLIISIIQKWRITPHGKLTPFTAIILKFVKNNHTLDSLNKISPIDFRNIENKKAMLVHRSPLHVDKISNIDIITTNGILNLKIYNPKSKINLPIIVYYHGGGWIKGNTDTHDNICRYLAAKTPAVTVSVNYRLAPENKFPAAHQDAFDSLMWVFNNADSINGINTKIALAGDSAGGNLAAAVSIMANEKKSPEIIFQLLFYPVLDISSTSYESNIKYFTGYYLTTDKIKWFRSLYFPAPNTWENKYASPLLDYSGLRLPETMIIVPEFDPLKSQSIYYSQLVKNTGSMSDLIEFKGVVHGFVSMDRFIKEAEDALKIASNALQNAFREKINN